MAKEKLKYLFTLTPPRKIDFKVYKKGNNYVYIGTNNCFPIKGGYVYVTDKLFVDFDDVEDYAIKKWHDESRVWLKHIIEII